MRYFKSVKDGVIETVGTGSGGIEITEEEYNEILSAFADRQKSTETRGYRLTTGLTWEPFDIEPQEYVPTIEEQLAEAQAQARKLLSIRSTIETLRDEALLPSTKAIYQAILDLFD